MLIENVFNGRDNTIDLLLKADGSAVDLSDVTRMTLTVGSVTLDSTTHPSYFDWTHTPAVAGKLVLALGAASLTAGEYQSALLTVYSADNLNGVRWPQFYINVY